MPPIKKKGTGHYAAARRDASKAIDAGKWSMRACWECKPMKHRKEMATGGFTCILCGHHFWRKYDITTEDADPVYGKRFVVVGAIRPRKVEQKGGNGINE